MRQAIRFQGLFLVGLAAASTAGCSDPTAGCSTVVAAPSGDAAKDRENIQTAFSNATSGSVVCLRPGTYKLLSEVNVSSDGVTVRSTSDGTAVLDFTGQAMGQNGFTVTAVKGFTAQDLHIKNTNGDGIKASKSDRVTFRRVTVTWDAERSMQNGGYGIYPTQCTHVLIEGCKAQGATDTGIYVGQSNSVIVKDSEAYGNVAGIEIENTNDAEVYNNYTHDNAGGLLVFDLPNLDQHVGARTRAHDNRIENNNGSNFASPAGIVSVVPPGTGILVMAAQNAEIDHNTVKSNDSAGIALVSYFVVQKPFTDAQYDPYPEANYVHDNTVSGNGGDPQGLAFQIGLLANLKTIPELVWDGLVDKKKDNSGGALTNCWRGNGDADFVNLNLDDQGLAHPSTDASPFACTHAALPAVTF